MIVISKQAKLDFKMGYLVVRGETTTKVHLSEVHTLLIEHTAVSITCFLLEELVSRKIKVIFCDRKRNPHAELLPYYGAHDTSQKVRMQIAWDGYAKAAIWTEIVTEKIRKQCELLGKFKKTEQFMLQQYVTQIEFGDVTNREGHAAKVYFNALFGMQFTRTEETPINAALNYGYSLLLSAVNREISACGYFTQIGIFHDNMYNPFNLGSDLMEPFRPLVDERVAEMMPAVFEKEEKYALVDLLNCQVRMEGGVQYLTNAIKVYVKSVFEALNERDISLIRFYQT